MTKVILLIIVAVVLNSCVMINSSLNFPAYAADKGCHVDESLLDLPTLEKIPDDMKDDQDFVEKKLVGMLGTHRAQLKLLIAEIKSCQPMAGER